MTSFMTMIQTESNNNIKLTISLVLLRTGPTRMVNLLAPKSTSSKYYYYENS